MVAVPVGWFTHPLWMPLIYRYLDASQPPLYADLIIIPGGSPYRVVTGVQLYTAQYAPQILISGSADDIVVSKTVLLRHGIPESDISVVRGGTNTWNEAQYNFQYLQENNIRSVLIVTDTPHTRRLRAVYATLNYDGIGITVISSPFGNENSWWKDDQVRNYVFEEYLKMLFYFLRYDVWSWS